MASLNLHGPVALALIVWYLMLPPMTFENASGEPRVASDEPLRTWKIIGTYGSAAECHQAAWRGLQNAKNVRQLYPDWPGSYHAAVVKSWFDAVCISADDPLLKEK
jgi:hypothetical protein